MATFPPFKAWIVEQLDELIEQHGLAGPFLDGGCGTGDVAAHLAARGWTGVALDSSEQAVTDARARLRGHPGVRVVHGALEELREGPFATVVLLDVLEHIAGDEATLHALAAQQPAGGMLVLTVPTHPEREWRWDDDVYGHLRRYSPGALAAVLHRTGYELVEVRDVTFPFFWVLRRGYTALKAPPPMVGSPEERSGRSSTAKAWDLGRLSDLLANRAAWRPLLALQRRFRHRIDAGHEVIALARRR